MTYPAVGDFFKNHVGMEKHAYRLRCSSLTKPELSRKDLDG